MNYEPIGGLVMTCGSPFSHMLKNIMVEMFDSTYLWKIRDDKESEGLTNGFCFKPGSFPRPKRVVL